MITDPLCINKININGSFIDIVDSFKYLGETITYNLSEKAAWKARISKLSRGQHVTRDTYKRKSLSIHTKLKHYKAVLRSQAMYCSETLFNIDGNGIKETIRRVERRILRTCINKKHVVDNQFRLLPREQIYREIEPITDAMRKKRISFFGHILRTPTSRLLRRLIEKFMSAKTDRATIPWLGEIKKDISELNLTIDDVKNRTTIYRETINDRKRILPIKTIKRRQQVCSEELRKERSDRMKRYWEEKKRSEGNKQRKRTNQRLQ